MADLKSLAHPDWPYVGTPHEWRGFARKTSGIIYAGPDRDYRGIDALRMAARDLEAIYQKRNFGPELK